MKIVKTTITLSLLIYSGVAFSQNGSIGMGTDTPNANAVLDLVSPENNQGLLVPRLTTTQRTDPTFMNNLGAVENSLLVYDLDDNQFYYWIDDHWQTFGQAVTPSLTFDDQTFELTISGGNSVSLSVFVDEFDSDPTNELQSITFANDTLFLSGNGGNVGIDTSSVNEIQDLELSGSILTITNNPSASPIDLGGLGIGPQSLSYDSASNTLSISGGNALELSGSGVGDRDSANEIQDLQLSSDILTITNNPSASNIDLSSYLDDTDEQNLSLVGTDLSIDDGNTVDLSSISKWSQVGSRIFYDAGDVSIERNFLTPPGSTVININSGSFTFSNITQRAVLVNSGLRTNAITRISQGQDGQELMLIGSSGTFVVNVDSSLDTDTGTNLIMLGAASRTLGEGDMLKLMYVSALSRWIEISYSNNFFDTIIGSPQR